MNTKPQGIAQPTISEVLQEFLDEQREQLKSRTFAHYEDVIELFQASMNGYAYNYLDEEDGALFDELYNQHDIEFCDIFGPDKILGNVDEFLGYFMVRKVIASQELLKAAGTVMKKLARWLQEKGYTAAEEAEVAVEAGAEAARSLPQAEKLAGLLYDFAHSQLPEDVIEQVDDRFTIERVEPGKLWLSGWMSSAGTVGPIAVPRVITDLAEEGWAVTLWLGRTRRGWQILDVGNVYPM
jgi:glutamine synthetase adenylyltransferase